MSYQAIARKYRPETFAQMVGQDHVTLTLRAALRLGKLSHGYLFSGPRGCGKTTVARLLAKALNCTDTRDGEPCGECPACLSIARGTFLDVLEIDAASNTGVDSIRDLRDMAKLAPAEGHSRIFIIDEVHMLSKGAFNALLKILEEPPTKVFFFFATTEPSKIPRTILSRCQRFDFHLLSREQLTTRMRAICAAERVAIDEGGLRVLASLAEGSMRDGLSLLDQAIASCENRIDEASLVRLFGLVRSEVYLELNEAIVAGDPARALRMVDELAAAGQDLVGFARGLLANFRNLLVLKVDPGLRDAIDLTNEQIAALLPIADHFAEQDLLALLDRAGVHYDRIHRSTQPRILLEAAIVEFCRWERRVLLADLVQRLRSLAGGAPDASSPPPGVAPAGRGRSGGARARPLRPASAPESAPPAPAASARHAAGTVGGWTNFVDVVMGQNPLLASCLMTGLPEIAAEQDRLTVAFAPENGFMLKRLEEGRAEIERQAAAFFGRPLRLVLQMVADGAGPSAEAQEAIRREVAPTERELLARQCAQDPELGRLVELVQGEPLPESERTKWRSPGRNPQDPERD
ncbi:MAG TPA: DNA polymerase III subunit gamma/tau [Candidatus Krumholzibacteria bacterium]|nr:DNA polymerase III subunit gamma/tau [Candidatus Krumholzibacteria bacterium]HPD72720.1 DNA polymerase III subunit gamma/tau [Candidatus Krumholzibacteria bacterium]HRY40348.1 DNA polymerase III subunit gamma/tau [Candidatus Krumholzibacteria bacterium]